MGTIKLAVRLLIQDFRKSVFYCGSLLFSSAIIFVFFNMMANPVYGGTTSFKDSANSFGSVLAIIVVIIAMVMVFFANSFYLMGKTRELAITTISGGNVLSLAGFLFTQNMIVMGIAIPFGVFLGYNINPIINTFVYNSMGVSSNVWQIYPIGVAYTIISITTETVWIILLNTGFAYRTELLDLLAAEKTMKVKDERIIRMPSILYYLIFIAPVILILTNKPQDDVYLFYTFISIFGILGIIKFSLPKIFVFIQKRFCLDNKHWIVAIGNLNHSSKQSGNLIIIIVAAFSVFSCLMCGFYNQTNYLVMIIMAYVVLVILMAVSIIYKVMIEAANRERSFKHLSMLGYIDKDIKKIIRVELSGLCCIVIIFPLIFVGSIFFKYIQAGLMDSTFALIVTSSYVLVFILSFIIAYFVYLNIVMKGKVR